jgi:hypothetical protein
MLLPSRDGVCELGSETPPASTLASFAVNAATVAAPSAEKSGVTFPPPAEPPRCDDVLDPARADCARDTVDVLEPGRPCWTRTADRTPRADCARTELTALATASLDDVVLRALPGTYVGEYDVIQQGVDV